MFKKGFTLMELVVVIAVISIIMSIVFTVVDPTDRINAAYEAAQKTDSRTIEKAISQYFIDFHDYSPLGISSESNQICDTGFNSFSEAREQNINCAGLVDLSKLIPTYIVGVPVNPTKSRSINAEDMNSNSSGYQVSLTDGKVEVSAIQFKTKPFEIDLIRGFNINDMRSAIVVLTFIIVLIVGIASFLIIKSKSRNNI